MSRSTRLTTALFVGGLLVPACGGGGDDPDAEARQAMVEDLRGSGSTAEEAECIADAMFEQFDDDQIEALTGDLEAGLENVSSEEFGQLVLIHANCENQE